MTALRAAIWAGLASWLAAGAALGQALPGPADGEAVVLEAGSGITWNRAAGTVVATGGATASYGGMTLSGQRLRAERRTDGGAGAAVTRVVADGEARFVSARLSLTGTRGVLDLAKERAELVGDPAVFAAPGGSGRAGERMVYDAAARVVRLLGGARVTRGAYTLRGETIVARFAEPAQPSDGPFPRPGTLARLEAQGGVALAGPEGKATARRGAYDAAARRVVLTGGVKLTRGGSTVTGEAARLNLATGESAITSAGDARVRAVLRRDDLEAAE